MPKKCSNKAFVSDVTPAFKSRSENHSPSSKQDIQSNSI